MTQKVNVLVPIGEAPRGASKAGVSPRLGTLEGSTIAIFSNSWQCMTYIADELRIRLTEDYGVKEVIRYDSPLTLPMPEHLLADAAARCDAVIVGMGT